MDKARKLVETDNVNMVLGPVNGMGDQAITGYMEEQRRPRIELAPTEELVAGGAAWNFMPHGSGMMYGYAVADYAYNDLGYKTVVGMGADMDAGHTFLGGFIGLQGSGRTIAHETYYPLARPTFCRSSPASRRPTASPPGGRALTGSPGSRSTRNPG